MNSLYNLAGRQISVIRADISTYSADPIGGATRRTHITSALSALIKTIEDYEAMAKRELVVAKREKALARVVNLHQEVRQLREELSRADVGQTAPTHSAATAHNIQPTGTTARARAIDMHSGGTTVLVDTPSFAPSSAYAPHATAPMQQAYAPQVMPMQSPYYAAQNLSAPNNAVPSSYAAQDPLAAYKAASNPIHGMHESPYSMRESHALREHSFIQNTEAQLDAFIAQGRSVLGNLVEQRSVLKETRKRLLDAANSVGLSRELIVRGNALGQLTLYRATLTA